MAGRRKRTGANGSGESDGFTVVVEELRSHFKVFGERLDGVEQRLDTRIDGLEQTMTAGFARVGEQLAELSHEVGRVKIAVLEHGRALKDKVDRDEVRAIVERATRRRS
jgi:hypothetical protein